MTRSCNFQALWLHIVEGLPAWAAEVERGTKDSLLNSLSNPWEHAGGRGEASQALTWLKARHGVVAQALVRALAQRVKEELAPARARISRCASSCWIPRPCSR